MANALLAVEFARPMVYVARYAVANATPHRDREVSVAKAMASRTADRVCRLALQCHGAIGYTFEYDLHLWMKRAWALSNAGRRAVPSRPRRCGPGHQPSLRLTSGAVRSWFVAWLNCMADARPSVAR